jgi:hypothetical protein
MGEFDMAIDLFGCSLQVSDTPEIRYKLVDVRTFQTSELIIDEEAEEETNIPRTRQG